MELQYKEIPTEDYFSLVRECMAASGSAVVRVTGVSMKPFLTPVRDTVTIVPLDRPLRIGDVALFDTRRGRYILHRVTKVTERGFDMRGDNTLHGEKGLPLALVVGVVSAAVRNGEVITAGSRKWRRYAVLGRFNRLYRAAWNGRLRPFLAKIYRFFIPRTDK